MKIIYYEKIRIISVAVVIVYILVFVLINGLLHP